MACSQTGPESEEEVEEVEEDGEGGGRRATSAKSSETGEKRFWKVSSLYHKVHVAEVELESAPGLIAKLVDEEQTPVP